jgi:hypothetical protein
MVRYYQQTAMRIKLAAHPTTGGRRMCNAPMARSVYLTVLANFRELYFHALE